MNHYQWLNLYFRPFLEKLGLSENILEDTPGLIVAHGDKCYGYKTLWELNGVPFIHGVVLYLLTYLPPWDKEVRNTLTGFVPPSLWVVQNYSKFKPFLNEIEDE